jgi:hypothetical protein
MAYYIYHSKTSSAGCACVYVSSDLSLDKITYYKIHRETADLHYVDVDVSSDYSDDRMSHTYMPFSLYVCFDEPSLNELLHTSQQNGI